jgi:hypothetical protein
MKKILIAIFTLSTAMYFYSCKPKATPASTCLASSATYFKDGATATYIPLFQNPGDSFLQRTYVQMTPGVFQVKNTALPSKTVNIPYYMAYCGNDIVVNELAYGIEKQFLNGNYFMKGIRKAGDVWQHKLNNITYYMGCAAKNINIFDAPFGDSTFTDKIWIRNTPAYVRCDTFYWNDTLGIIKYRDSNQVNSRTLLYKSF